MGLSRYTLLALAITAPLGAGCGDGATDTAGAAGVAATEACDHPHFDKHHEAWNKQFRKVEDALDETAGLQKISWEEDDLESIRTTVLDPLASAMEAKNSGAMSALFGDGFPATGSKGTSTDGIQTSSWEGSVDAETWLASWSTIRSVALDAEKIVPEGEGYRVDLRLDVRGVGTDGALRQERGLVSITATGDEDEWVGGSFTSHSGLTLVADANRTPAFADATARTALNEVPVQPRREAIRRGGYALAVADYDGDSRPDVLLGHLGPMQLLRNTPDGFVDVTKEVGLRNEDVVKAAGFADLDNDGDRDLVIVRFDIDDRDNLDDVEIYANDGQGRFEHKEGVLPRDIQYDHAMPLALADFDKNGLVDVYIGFPGSRDFTNDLENAPREGLAAQGLWLNQGNWSFQETKGEQVMSEAGQPLFPHSALVTDLNGDNQPDLMVIDDSKLDSVTYVNQGGKLIPSNEATGLQSGGYGMSATSGDFDGDGLVDIAVTRIELLASRRVTRSWAGRAPTPELGEALDRMAADLAGTTLFRNLGNGKFADVTNDVGLDWTGQAPAGVSFVDYDADGDLDLYVANGLWTGKGREVDSIFTRLSLLQDVDGELAEIAQEALDHPADDKEGSGEGDNPFMDMLAAHPADRADGRSLTFAGNERNRLYRNDGGTFTEVGYFEGADRIEDGYVAAAADFDGDGRQDLLLRNCDPAPGNTFPTVVLLDNQRPDTHSLTVHLEGTASNRDGIGALVAVRVGDQWQRREVQATAGALQSEPAAYFGLGGATQVDEIVVTWPSGQVDRIGATHEGRARLVEGSGKLDWLSEAAAPKKPSAG